MTVRAWSFALLIAATVGAGVPDAPALAQEGRREIARELAALTLDDLSRRRLEEQVTLQLAQAIGGTLQDRLSRPLQEVEWNMVARIVRRFVADTLTPGRAVEIAAEAYVKHFEEAELRELLAFQRTPVARKVARLSPVIAAYSAGAIDVEIRESAAMPRLVEDLQREFPILRRPETP